ncbi:MAG: class I SAM-dependent methyltransferase [Phycisphaerae bacterium]|nr:class I SAM-dependent methyltransferase [Phycisphaerae bacterium]
MGSESTTFVARNATIEDARMRADSVLRDWRGRGKIAVFAAGAHTAKILPILEAYADRIAGMIDDSPLQWGRRVGPWNVEPASKVIDGSVSGILISSDAQQEALAARARAEFGRDCAILTLYPPKDADPGAPHLPFTGERVTAEALEQVEIGHRVRYYWALQHLGRDEKVLDAACGNGYGSKILADGGCHVLAIDIAEDAIAFARHYYGHERIDHICASIDDAATSDLVAGHGPFDSVISFETIEHLHDPSRFLHAVFSALKPGGCLYCSTPNGDHIPVEDSKFHVKHHTWREMRALLNSIGFIAFEWFGQEGLQILRGRATERQRYCLYHARKP